MATSKRSQFLQSLYHHVVLPRAVPGCEDSSLFTIEADLLDRLTAAVKALIPHLPLNNQAIVDSVRLSLSTAKALNVEGKIDKHILAKELQNLSGNNTLILHVTEQNAGLLVYRQANAFGDDDDIIFEIFETSATCEEVLAAENALQWDFPGQAVAVAYNVVANNSFQDSLAAFMEQVSIESIKQFSAVTLKAAAPLPEIRDTTDPKIICGLLARILEANGRAFNPTILRKRVRDTVSFEKAYKPWRRSPFYLVLKVAVQRQLYKSLGPELGRLYYKTIMCLLITDLLDDALSFVQHETSFHLKAKMGRRLSKLVADRDRIWGAKDAHDELFRGLHKTFERSLSSAARFLESHWESFKRRSARIIRLLPQYAASTDLDLKLPVSGQYLDRVFHEKLKSSQLDQRTPAQVLGQYEKSKEIKPFAAVCKRYIRIAKFEEENIQPVAIDAGICFNPSSRCVHLAEAIHSYISSVADAFDDYSILKSGMILNLIGLWMAMDQAATSSFPLLSQYHPGFHPGMLDVLELSTLDQLKRLQKIQNYLHRRCQGWSGRGSKTIFASPAYDSFAVRYYNESADSVNMRTLRDRIELDAANKRAAKEREWEASSNRHETYMREIAELSCIYVTRIDDNGEIVREHKKGCKKHRLKWEAKQIKIRVFEHPLPKFEPAAKAAVFELACPEALLDYRDATWKIMARFAHIHTEPVDDVPILRFYSELQQYPGCQKHSHVSLGSSTKSHLECHYAESSFPVELKDVCRPCGLKLNYFDSDSSTWTYRLEEPSLASQCPLMLPSESPYHSLQLSYGDWPSSNRILASQTKCPADLNVHEFMAWQNLLVGTHSRWLSLLRELGSTNLNFSTESTWVIISRLIHQVGPMSTDCLLRDVHAVFEDETFCQVLLEQIRQRLDAIQRNWREPIQMDTLISMLIKVLTVSPTSRIQSIASGLLNIARDITWAWQVNLISSAGEQHSGPCTFTIWASVLCKRTFYELSIHGLGEEPEDLRRFIESSICLQNNLVGSFNALPYNLRNALLRDLISNFGIRYHIRDNIMKDSAPLTDALNGIWPIPQNSSMNVTFQSEYGWFVLDIRSGSQITHLVLYDVISGMLLINGQQLGLLPPEFRKWPTIETLFGARALRVLPSSLPGMSFVVAGCMPNSHWVHLGFRGERLIIRALIPSRKESSILELINPSVFGNNQDYDLPLTLVDNCFHWLDLGTGILEIRQADPWRSKGSNWKLNLKTRRAMRRGSTLVDPNSSLSKTAVRNFYYFEYPRQITVYQPRKRQLRVELKRLELDFFVNRAGLLQSPQLGGVVAESRMQDPGTWYGLRSKIVIRSTQNPSQHSVLVPLGEFDYSRDGQHVQVTIQNRGDYSRYSINNVLGRIDCPPEPRLLYTKVQLHAYTAHFIPDPLTGRTGVDEALYQLQNGLCQPWTAIPPQGFAILLEIAKLSPDHIYYPPSLKCMEATHWDSHLTLFIQDERYRGLVANIRTRLLNLNLFTLKPELQPQLPNLPRDMHLENRALSRESLEISTKDRAYQSRDCRTSDQSQANVTALAKLLSEWRSNIPTTLELAALLEKFKIIGGYTREFDKVQITDFLTIDLGEEWGPLARAAINAGYEDRYTLAFTLAPVAFSTNINMDILRVLIAFATIKDLKRLVFPKYPSYIQFRQQETPDIKHFVNLMAEAKVVFVPSRNPNSVQRGQLALEKMSHEKESSRHCEEFADSIGAQWPSTNLDPNRLIKVDKKYFDTDEALDLIQTEWTRLTHNNAFSKHLEDVQLVLNRNNSLVSVNTPAATVNSTIFEDTVTLEHSKRYPMRLRGGEVPSLQDLLQIGLSRVSANPVDCSLHSALTAACTSAGSAKATVDDKASTPVSLTSHIHELSELVADLRDSSSSVQKLYGEELEQSIKALLKHVSQPKTAQKSFDPTQLRNEISRAKRIVDGRLKKIRVALAQNLPQAKWLQLASVWPNMTLVTLLSELRSTSCAKFGKGVRSSLLDLGLSITAYQHLLRIEDAALGSKYQQFEDEMVNIGHQNWSPSEYPEWLLLEIEGNILLRPDQVEVAHATISPESGTNSVLQLLMGKGKTSCILPMVALVLANGAHVFRIIVPRPLLLQSAQVMLSKLGGLLNRDILHLPFSRGTITTSNNLETYFQVHRDLQKRRGIIIALPEHILSFKLSGLQRLCDGKVEEASTMIKIQNWLDSHARDVMDECDVSLAIRTQLIYPSGSQMAVDGHPLRWQVIEALLRLIHSYLPELRQKYPQSVEVVNRMKGGYPLVYFLRSDAEEHLISRVINDICAGHTSVLPSAGYLAEEQSDIKAFISCTQVSPEVLKQVKAIFKDQLHLMKVVFLLRGLFVHRILISTLKKRWNVQYGLHPERDPIAVPYLAKGVPSPSAEWGHPDVAIILTCLSFYYDGLTIAQFKQAFEQLSKSDEPSVEYEKWATKDLPEELCNYHAINTEDASQLHDLHYYVQCNVHLLDFYMNNFVFPRHAKQFKSKLQASGWDLVLYDPSRNKVGQTTGFSGTNDSRHQLPLTITQNDLPQLAHTNAEVLSYLLQDRNRHYVCMVDDSRKRLSETGLLKKLLNPRGTWPPSAKDRIRILIDAGAQILEHENRSLAMEWLDIDHEAAAAVFFDSNHRAMVVYGKGKEVPLSASPFAENLGDCLVYLDESHCRGTDLKLPPHARAALTLGPHLTKDAMAQAAMRLRLLGQTQSVSFFSPPEVHQSILDLCHRDDQYRPDSADVVRWLLQKTCDGIEQLEPLYFKQGHNHLHGVQARLENSAFLKDIESRDRYLAAMRTEESQTLKELYEPKFLNRNTDTKPTAFAPALQPFISELQRRKRGFQDRGIAVHSSALEEVEQEREIEYEIENVREVQKPMHFTALKFSKLHPDIAEFARTGKLPAGSGAYQPMPSALQETALGAKHGALTAATMASALFVSTQFSRTVSVAEPNDNFLRPCQWILWSHCAEISLIVSPEEANLLIPILRRSSSGTHLIVYAAPVTRRMLHFNSLDYYAIPPLPYDFNAPLWLKIQLGIFAGRLYFEWDEYEAMRQYFGMSMESPETNGSRGKFSNKPLTFLHDWLAVRRKGQDFEHTPMGFITTGKPLTSDHPFFLSTVDDKDLDAQATFAPLKAEKAESEGGDDNEDEEFYDAEDGTGEYGGHEIDADDFDEAGNTFFEGSAYVEEPQNTEQDVAG